MPPKGNRICIDDLTCTHVAGEVWECTRCISRVKETIEDGTSYLCLECRTRGKEDYGIQWPRRGVKETSSKAIKPKLIERARIKVENGISRTCAIHSQIIKNTQKYCDSCIEAFSEKVEYCNTCEGHHPDDMESFCDKHKKWWDTQMLRWVLDTELFRKAAKYPLGETEQFLKGLSELCVIPRGKK